MSDVIERLVALRKAAGVGNRELDRLAGITEGHSWLIEHRKKPATTNNLSANTLAKLADALGCSLDYLASGKGEPPTDDEIAAAVGRCRERLAEPPSTEVAS